MISCVALSGLLSLLATFTQGVALGWLVAATLVLVPATRTSSITDRTNGLQALSRTFFIDLDVIDVPGADQLGIAEICGRHQGKQVFAIPVVEPLTE